MRVGPSLHQDCPLKTLQKEMWGFYNDMYELDFTKSLESMVLKFSLEVFLSGARQRGEEETWPSIPITS